MFSEKGKWNHNWNQDCAVIKGKDDMWKDRLSGIWASFNSF